jgi:glutamine amidotransferase
MNLNVILDTGSANLMSLSSALIKLKFSFEISANPSDILKSDRLILPGVGSFPHVMKQIQAREIDSAIKKAVQVRKIPLLGICLGMQLLAESSTEGHLTSGLSLIPGNSSLIAPTEEYKVPHVGFNKVSQNGDSPLFSGIPDDSYFYFVHSYALQTNESVSIGYTDHCGKFTSAIDLNHKIFGVQFHPEKSKDVGLQLLRNFMEV